MDPEWLVQQVDAANARHDARLYANYVELALRQITTPTSGDPELPLANCASYHDLCSQRLREYGLNLEGLDANAAMRMLVGVLFMEIDQLKAIIEAQNGG